MKGKNERIKQFKGMIKKSPAAAGLVIVISLLFIAAAIESFVESFTNTRPSVVVKEADKPMFVGPIEIFSNAPTVITISDWAAADGDVVNVAGQHIKLIQDHTMTVYPWIPLLVVGVDAGQDGKLITVAVRGANNSYAQFSLRQGETVQVPVRYISKGVK